MPRRVIVSSVALAGALLTLAGCSSDDGAQPDTRAGDIRTNDVWKDGLELTGTVRIIAPAVVEIEPGAKIKCAPGAQILVGGTLRKAAGARSKIACAQWGGIVVAQAGKLELDGFDLENGGIETTEGAADSTVTDASIKGALKPFLVGTKSKLTLTKVDVAVPSKVDDNVVSIAEVRGSLVASRLDYDAGPNEGISLKEGGEAVIEDSNIHGTNGRDMVSAYKAKSLKLSYSTLTGAHCGPHIEGIDAFTIDHITSEKNTYGLTIYGAGAGPNVVKDSNLSGDAAWLDLQGDHGPITFENVHFTGGKEVVVNTDPPKLPPSAPAPIANAKPR
jgi:hypothetical protein